MILVILMFCLIHCYSTSTLCLYYTLLSVSICETRAIGHWFWEYSSFRRTIIIMSNFQISFHLIQVFRLIKKSFFSFFHLDLNTFVMCWIRLHFFLQYRSTPLKVHCSGIITLVFIVSRLLGEISIKLFESLTVSTVKVLELISASSSAINVLRLSLS